MYETVAAALCRAIAATKDSPEEVGRHATDAALLLGAEPATKHIGAQLMAADLSSRELALPALLITLGAMTYFTIGATMQAAVQGPEVLH